jgi:hypothetical protein
VVVTKTGERGATAALLINGELAGTGVVPDLCKVTMTATGHGLTIGRSGMAVSALYRAPFIFTGTIEDVVFDLEADGAPRFEGQLRTAFGTE